MSIQLSIPPFHEQPFYPEFVADYTPEQRVSIVRFYRNSLLLWTDFTQLPDSPVDSAPWAAYRQALRDFMDTYDGTETNPVFPPPPA